MWHIQLSPVGSLNAGSRSIHYYLHLLPQWLDQKITEMYKSETLQEIPQLAVVCVHLLVNAETHRLSS